GRVVLPQRASLPGVGRQMESVSALAERTLQLLELHEVGLPFRLARPLVPARSDGANEAPWARRPFAVGVVEWVHAPRRGVEASKRELLSEDDLHPSISSEASSSSALLAGSACPSRYSSSRGQKTSVMGCARKPAALIAVLMSTSNPTSCS